MPRRAPKSTINGVLCAVFALVLILAGRSFGQGDPETIAKIIDEGKNRSQVWQHLEYLSHEIGPRLTGSSRLLQANACTRDMYASWGLHAYLHKWGEVPVAFDRGPCRVRMVEPVEQEFEFTTRSWTAGTNGPVRGKVIKQPATMEELEAIRDQLKGAWVLSKSRPRQRRGVVPEGAVDPDDEIAAAMYEAGIAGRLVGALNDLVVTTGARNWRELEFNSLPNEVSITIRRADYDAINSRLADGEEVIVEADLQHHFVEGPFPLYNTIAEIRGTEWPEQVVIVSAHLDSWDGPGSQGAQDNGTGSAVTLEAARILATVGVRPKRTIRFCLWTGEEQGLLGSCAYVESLSDEQKANISAVFVDDGGTNYQGGLVCVESMVDMLRAATAPVNEAFPDMPVEMIIRDRMPRGGGSDHASFNRAGIPGFFWDERGSGGREGKNYRFVHHTQHDTTRYAVPEYLVQSATCSAVTAYNLAMADSLLPRFVEPPETEDVPDEVAGDFTPTQGPLTGRWIGEPTGENAPPMRIALQFEHSVEGRIRGYTEGRGGRRPLREIAFDSATSKLTFVYESPMFGAMTYEAIVAGDQMKGTVKRGEEFNIAFEATREQASAASVSAAAQPAGDTNGQAQPAAAEAGAPN